MDVTIKEQKEMSLLSRKDVLARVAHQGATPSRQQLRAAVAKALKSDAALVVVRRVRTEFGAQASVVEASVYNDKAALDKFEPEHMKKRNGENADQAPEKEAEA